MDDECCKDNKKKKDVKTKSCARCDGEENVSKKRPKTKGEEENELQSDIDELIQLISNVKYNKVESNNYKELIKSCEITKEKIRNLKTQIHNLAENSVSASEEENCACIKKCKANLKEFFSELPATKPACEACSETILEPQSRESESCKSCPLTIDDLNDESNKSLSDVPPDDDDSLGYFETIVQTRVKVTRTLQTDGSVKEEKETTTVEKKRRDPTKFEMLDDDDEDDNDYIDNEDTEETEKQKTDAHDKHVTMCTLPIQCGVCIRKVKSNVIGKMSPTSRPILRQCISFGSFNSYSI